VAGNRAPGHFHGHDGRSAFEERDHQNAHHVEKGMFFVGGFCHVGCDGSDQSVAQQDAEESSNQGGGDFISDFFGRSAECAHGDDDAEHGGDDSETGRESAMVLRAAVGAAES